MSALDYVNLHPATIPFWGSTADLIAEAEESINATADAVDKMRDFLGGGAGFPAGDCLADILAEAECCLDDVTGSTKKELRGYLRGLINKIEAKQAELAQGDKYIVDAREELETALDALP